MTDEDLNSDGQKRRSVLKALGVGGLAATGLTAATGSAAAQSSNRRVVSKITNVQNIVQDGDQVGTGLIVVQVQNVAVADLLDVSVAIGDSLVEVQDIEILNNNTVQIVVNDVVDATVGSVQVAVTLLGTTVQDADNLFATADTTTIRQ